MPFEAVFRAWALPLGLAVAAMLAGLLAHRISRKIVKRLTRHSPVLSAIVDRMDGPLHLLLPLAALAVVLDSAGESLPGIDALRHLCGVVLIAALTWIAIEAQRRGT